MDLDDVDGPESRWVSPDDRLWRHPSEVGLVHPARRARVTPWSMGLLGGTIGAMLVAGLLIAGGAFRPTTVIEQVAVPLGQPPTSSIGIPEIAARVRPAIVQVDVAHGRDATSASGVLFRSDGHILTNNHVVADASKIEVILTGGETLPARLIGSDPETDIAVLKVEGKDFPVAVLGSAASLRVGQVAIAIGSPLGLAGGPSVSVGVISALAREVPGDDGHALVDMIQTDAPIAPGSSGGALLDSTGAVIGITTAIAIDDRVGAEGLGFATPIDVARDVADQLVRTGRVTHAWLGIEGEDASAMGLAGVDSGALVKRVRNGSPAAAAGLSPGDVITGMEGSRVSSMSALVARLRARRPGDTVQLEVVRGGKKSALTATLMPRPPATDKPK